MKKIFSRKQVRAGLFLTVTLMFIAAGFVSEPGAQNNSITELIREKIELMRSGYKLQIGENRIASIALLPRMYERNNLQLLWTEPAAVADLLKAVKNIAADGLNPQDYHLRHIAAYYELMQKHKTGMADTRVNYDFLLSDSLVRMGYHVLFGKIDPEDLHPHWNLTREIRDRDPAGFVVECIRKNKISKTIESLKPENKYYIDLKANLTRYREIRRNGGWTNIPSGEVLKKGKRDPRVALLKLRLSKTGDYKTFKSKPDIFDEELELAVKSFQRRHLLKADGIVGKNTLAQMNVPVDDRIDQIRVNLERLRWVLHQKLPKFVLADIAGFQVFYIENRNVKWTGRAQVGTPYRETPSFIAQIKYLVINPTWTIPPTILAEDVLPAIKRNPSYLKKRNISVLNRKGQAVKTEKIDWSRYTSENFPFILRQEPGPTNALGRIKIIFPNPEYVYLHDTPSRYLFAREDRAFSSGCIRVENVFELAGILLANKNKWNRKKLMEIVATNKTRTLRLPRPIPVVLLYWTVDIDPDGDIIFKKDVYNRDKAVLASLDSRLELKDRHPGEKKN